MRRLFALSLLLPLAACIAAADEASLRLIPQEDRFIARGVIDGSTPEVVRRALAAHPELRTVVMEYVPGSRDDDANLLASRMLRQAGVTMIVPEGGLVASGGTDMFLAGVERRTGPGACLGVHSWASGFGPFGTEGRDLPSNDPEHRPYLDYYADMGVDAAFYWYTLEAADAADIHYMSPAELRRFGMTTAPVPTGAASYDRCEALHFAQ